VTMNKADFIKLLDHSVIEAAIARAESVTSGEIRVAVIHEPTDNPVARAKEIFVRMGMTKTKHRNAVLILVAPSSQTFAVIGDEGVHQKCGPSFWVDLAGTVTGSFKLGNYTAGLIEGINRAGSLLAAHFPREAGDANELPDAIIRP